MFYDPKTALHQEDDGEIQDLLTAPSAQKKQSLLTKLALALWRRIRG